MDNPELRCKRPRYSENSGDDQMSSIDVSAISLHNDLPSDSIEPSISLEMDVESSSVEVVSIVAGHVGSNRNDDIFHTNIRTINDLPQEMLAEIFSYLSVEDLVFRIKHVCEHWAEVSQDPRVWKYITYKPVDGTPLHQVIDVLTQACNLEIFHASSEPGTDISILQAASESCKSIRKLSISVDSVNCNAVEDILSFKLNHCIEELRISLVGIGDEDSVDGFDFDEKELLNCIGKCVNLQSLTLNGIILNTNYYNFFEGIALGCPKLQELNILFLCGFTQHDLEFLLAMKGDQLLSLILDWNWSRLKSTLPVVSRHCTKLEKLGVGCYSSKPARLPDMFKDSKIVPDDFVALKKMPFLKELSMPHLGNSNLHHFVDLFETGHLCHLIKLNLSFVDCVEGRLLWTIFQNCQTLKYLKLMGCSKILNDSFETIDNLKQLECLNIESCTKVTDEGIEHIVKCKTLRYLNLNFCHLLTVKSLKMCCQNLRSLYKIRFNSCSLEKRDLHDIPKHLLRFLGFY